ncbi:MAG TPA: cupin domain-containing protein [Burkholderiales bacterium]|nr:cupin domain-containing protein [Burkholderiales bacterium]
MSAYSEPLRRPSEHDALSAGGLRVANADLGRAFGPLMREARKKKQLTLQQVADRAELSVSYLSQIERNLLTPSVGTLKRIAGALGIPTGQLIAPDAGAPKPVVAVLRKHQRKRIAFPQSNVSYELLMPDFRRRASALWVTAEPGGASGPAQTHEGEDMVIVLKGALSVDVAGTWHELKTGDTICFNSELPHRWCNRGSRVAQAIWISSPPYL